MTKLLLVEDEAALCYIIQSGLEDIIGDYEVITASNGKEGLKAWKEHRPDIIVSDIDMPEMSGLEMVERIREMDGDTPVIFSSALTTPKDVKRGYQIGANNYVKKPFTPDELDAHIQALLKMKNGEKSRTETLHYRLGRFTLDAAHATLRDNSQTPPRLHTLTQREAQLLQVLAGNANEVVTREAILSRYWETEGNDFYASRSLDVFINKLRKYFKDEPAVEIKTVRGVGLMLLLQNE